MQFDRDISTITPASAPAPLETGWYPANVAAIQDTPNKKGTGSFLEIKHRISSGPSTGKVLTSRHNWKHPNPVTVGIAYEEIAAIAHAVGRPNAKTPPELLGGPLEFYAVKVPRDDVPGLFGNDIKGFRAIGAGGSQPGFSGAVGTQVAAAPAWAAPAQPAAQAYNAPGAPVNAPQWAPAAMGVMPQPAPAQPQWAPPPAAAAPAQPTYAPQPATQPVAAAPAAAGSVPPWAR